MPDVSAKIKGLNIEFNDNLINSPNIESGDDIKTSFARIHKRFSQMKSGAYIDASISNNKTITLGDSNIGVVSIFANQGLTDIEKTNARTNIGAGTSNFSGSFNDLTDKPTTIAGYGITDAFSGSFTDLTNKPTTISGYGITDAKIQNGTITLGGNTITPITSFSSLDSPLVGGSGKYISSISETDGIISATETSMDTVPTENSANAITSGAVYTDSANQQLEINYAINTGAKNVFPNIAVSQTVGGVTFTVNDDGTVTANGTKTNNDWFILSENNSFDAGTYTLSDGLPDDTINCRLIISTARSMSATIMSTETNLRTQTRTFTTAKTGLYYAIRIASGATVNNLTFKPMIRRAEVTDDSYEPYAPTNRELYETKTEQTETNVIANLGAKNLLQYNGYGTGAENGVTYVINSDGTITVNGTPQGTSPSYIELKLNGNAANAARFCDGNHILSGCPEGGSDSTYRMYAARSTYSRFDYGNGVLLTATTLTDVRLVIYIANGYTANNLVFKPMIRRAEITDDTYVPYAPTNRELYEMILALQSGGSVQSVNPTSTLNLSRNDLNEQLDTNFDLIDSIPEEEEGEEDE